MVAARSKDSLKARVIFSSMRRISSPMNKALKWGRIYMAVLSSSKDTVASDHGHERLL